MKPNIDLTMTDQPNSLKKDIASSLTNPAFHNVIIVSSDGVNISANRTILALRSTFFNSILYSDMQETISSRITLHNINSMALHAVLQYIYKEDVDWMDILEAINVYHAADYLILPELMKLVPKRTRDIGDFSVSLLNDAVISLPWSESSKELYDILFKPLRTRLLTVGDLNGLSENALELFLTKTTEFNTPEYSLLLCIIEWAWAQNPTAQSAAERRAIFDTINLMPTDSNSEILLKNGPSHTLLLKMIQYINFSLICPHRLKSLTDAVDIFTETLPQNLALYHYACKNTKCFESHPSRTRHKSIQFQWDKSKLEYGLSLSEDGTVVSSSNNELVVRTSTPCKADSNGLCELGIIFEHSGDINVGFVTENGTDLEWGIVESITTWSKDEKHREGDGNILNSTIIFHVDLNNDSCAISINGWNHVVWTKPPNIDLYPAVILECGDICRIVNCK